MEIIIREVIATVLSKSRRTSSKKKIKNKVKKIKFTMRATSTDDQNKKYKGTGNIAIRGALVGKIVEVFTMKAIGPLSASV